MQSSLITFSIETEEETEIKSYKYMLFETRHHNTVTISFVNLDKSLMHLRIKSQEQADYKIDYNNAIQQTKPFTMNLS